MYELRFFLLHRSEKTNNFTHREVKSSKSLQCWKTLTCLFLFLLSLYIEIFTNLGENEVKLLKIK